MEAVWVLLLVFVVLIVAVPFVLRYGAQLVAERRERQGEPR